MGNLRVIICRVNEQNDNEMTELASFDMPEIDVGVLKPDTALDDLESSTHKQGYKIMRRLLEVQWEEIDESLAEAYCQDFSP